MYLNDTQRLNWQSFNTVVLTQRADLYKSRKFSDVTLVSDDLVRNPVHKHILSGSSAFLESLLDITQETSPLLYIKGVSQAVLECIIKFVYLGEVSIKTHIINEFFKVANELGISAIRSANHVQSLEELQLKERIVKNETIPTMDFLQTQSISKENGLSLLERCQDDDSDVEIRDAKDLQTVVNLIDVDVNKKEETINDDDIDEADRIEDEAVLVDLESTESVSTNQIEEERKNEKQRNIKSAPPKIKKENPVECTICAKTFTTLRSFQRHNKYVHELQGIMECDLCGKKTKGGLHHLNKHKESVHYKQGRVHCDQCDKSFSTKLSLRSHKAKKHPLPDCDYCKIEFQTMEQFNQHIQEHISGKFL